MSEQNKYVGTLIRGMAQIEDQLRYSGGQGNGMKELLSSLKYTIPEFITKEIGKLVNIRNQVAHSTLILDEDDIEYIKKKLRKILEYFGEELNGDWDSKDEEDRLSEEMWDIFSEYKNRFENSYSSRISNFLLRLSYRNVYEKGFSEGTMNILKDILTDELNEFKGFDTTAPKFIELISDSLEACKKPQDHFRMEETLEWLEEHIEQNLSYPTFDPDYFSEKEIDYFFKHFKPRGEKWRR